MNMCIDKDYVMRLYIQLIIYIFTVIYEVWNPKSYNYCMIKSVNLITNLIQN